MAQLDLSHASRHPMPVRSIFEARITHIQRMLLAAVIAAGGIIAVAAAMMTTLF